MSRRVNFGGFVVAGIGFFLTRFTVTLAIYEDPVRFYMAGVVPLVLGLGLAAFGVALAVADLRPALVRTTAVWCVLGLGTMSILVVLTLLGSTTDGQLHLETLRSQVYLSNFLIGGAVGGTLTGLYASHNRRQRRELRNQAKRLEVLNRWLRHEILNALTAIRGYAGLDRNEETQTVIENRTASIEETIEEVKYLTQSATRNDRPVTSDDLETYLRDSIDTIRDDHPDADISLSVHSSSAEATVLASDRLTYVFGHLLENAVLHSPAEATTVDVQLTDTANSLRVSVSDDGPGLPDRQQALLETGESDQFDTPESGYGLNIVRLLVESYHGEIETDVTDEGSTITIALPRADADRTGIRSDPTSMLSLRPSIPQLLVTLAAALIAGVSYGIVSELLGGSIAGIGVFYGISDPIVGWLTHQFHSVVFGFVFAGLVSFTPLRFRDNELTRLVAYVAIGLGWALTLWVVAAGLIAPVWLRLLGLQASIPNLTFVLLANHLAWGLTLGILDFYGGKTVTPRIVRFRERLG